MNYTLTYADYKYKLNSKTTNILCPVLSSEKFTCYPFAGKEVSEISHLTDGSMAMKSEAQLIDSLNEGINFDPEKQGIFLYVVEDNKTKKIIAKAYVKFWHYKSFKRPRFHLTVKGGIEIIDARKLKAGNNIVEIGGVFVDPQYRGHKLSNLLLAARMLFIKKLQNYIDINSVLMINIGPFKAKDNIGGIDFSQVILKELQNRKLIAKADIQSLLDIEGKGEVLTRKDFAELANNFNVEIIHGKGTVQRAYKFGLPRKDSYPAYLNSLKLISGQPLIYIDEKPFFAPFDFIDTRCIHYIHGGSYFISHL